MSRTCSLTGTKAQYGHKVSHSNRKSNRRFQVNVQNVTLYSELLRKSVPLKVSAATLRSVDHNGGLDKYLLTAKAANLTPEGQKLRRQVKKALLKAGTAPKPEKKERKPRAASAGKATKAKKKAD